MRPILFLLAAMAAGTLSSSASAELALPDGMGGYYTDEGHYSSDGMGGYYNPQGNRDMSDGAGGYYTDDGHLMPNGTGGYFNYD